MHAFPLLRSALTVTSVAMLLLSSASSSSLSRDFDWVQVDPLTLSTNPTFLQSSLAVTASGEPVRARLLESHLTQGIRYMGDYAIEHFASDGTLLWQGVLLGNVDVFSLRVDSGGATVVIGAYRETLFIDDDHQLSDASGQHQPFYVKFGADREVTWLIEPAATLPNLRAAEALAIDSQDRVWVGLATSSNFTVVRRLNPDGTADVDYVQDGTRAITGIAVDPDGTVWTTGSTQAGLHDFNGLAVETSFSYNIYVAKYAPSGVGAWAQFVEDVTFQDPRIVSDGLGSAYVAGSLFGNFSFGDLTPEGIDWIYDFFLTKIDATGEFIWLREVPADGVSGDAGRGGGQALEVSGTGSIWFSGFSRFDVDWGNDGNVPPSYGSQDVLVLEYSLDGAFQSAKTAGSPGFDVADAVGVAPDGTVFVAGTIGEDSEFDDQSFTGNFTNTFIAALPPDGVSGVDGVEPEWPPHSGATVLSLANHPNPFRPDTRIRFRLPEPGPVRLVIFDAVGSVVRVLRDATMAAGSHSVLWDGRDGAGRFVSSGVYPYRLETGALRATGRATVIR